VRAAKIGWLTTVLLCLLAAVLLLVDGYVGYFGVVLAVGLAAAVNLT
jgi:membrane-bound ClpP family serine protease